MLNFSCGFESGVSLDRYISEERKHFTLGDRVIKLDVLCQHVRMDS